MMCGYSENNVARLLASIKAQSKNEKLNKNNIKKKTPLGLV